MLVKLDAVILGLCFAWPYTFMNGQTQNNGREIIFEKFIRKPISLYLNNEIRVTLQASWVRPPGGNKSQ